MNDRASLNLISPQSFEENTHSRIRATPKYKSSLKTNLAHLVGISPKDIPYMALCLGAIAYFTFRDPLFVTVLGCLSIILLGLWHITRAIPLVEKYLGAQIRFWHVATVILGLTIFLSLFNTPAHAFFLSGLESFFQELVAGAQSTDSSIDTEAVTLVFNLIRGVFLILVVAAALFAYNQAQQGNDWRPIITQVGIAFGIVIAIDIITYLFTPQA